MILLVITTGIRKGEACGLTWSAVDFEKNTIQVRQSAQFVEGQGMVLSAPKTEKGKRLIVVPAYVVEVLKEHKARQNEWKQTAPYWHEMDLVFPNSKGEPRHETNLRREWQALVRQSGLPYIRFHDPRHTHASLLLLAGVNPKIVQERLGHSSITLTLDLYSHSIPSLQEEAAERIGDMLKL